MKRKATREERIGEEEVVKGEVDVEMKVVALLVEEVLQAEEGVVVVLLVEEEEGVDLVLQEEGEVEEEEAKAGMGWSR